MDGFLSQIKGISDWRKPIADYLTKRKDIQENLKNPKKNFRECCQFILTEAKKKGNVVAMTDEEVFSLAVHYYDEDDVTVDRTIKAAVSAPETVKEDAAQQKVEQKKKKASAPKKKPAEKEKQIEQMDLFSFLGE